MSRRSFPKQFIALTGGPSLLENTLDRLALLRTPAPILCIAAEDMHARTRQALNHAGLNATLILEPEARNTAPAIAAVAYIAHAQDSDAVLLVLPADHVIDDHQHFAEATQKAAAAATVGQIIILGVRPKEASPAFGYIIPGQEVLDGVRRVDRFVEKPDPERAAQLIESGALWNAGIVVARADTVIAALNLHEPRVSKAVRRAVETATRRDGAVLLDRAAFAEAPSISFDHAVLERHGNVRVVSLEAGWRDVGTWTEVAALIAADDNDNRISGDVRLAGSRGNFLFSPGRLTVGLGLEDLLVINTPDALLISHKDRLGLLGDTVKAMIAEARPEALVHLTPDMTAGGFAESGPGGGVSTRRIVLEYGQSLQGMPDLQRDTHWIVVAGEATVYCGGDMKTLSRNQSHFVAAGTSGRIENRKPGILEIIELQIATPDEGAIVA